MNAAAAAAQQATNAAAAAAAVAALQCLTVLRCQCCGPAPQLLVLLRCSRPLLCPSSVPPLASMRPWAGIERVTAPCEQRMRWQRCRPSHWCHSLTDQPWTAGWLHQHLQEQQSSGSVCTV
jgi:hypothetical protein